MKLNHTIQSIAAFSLILLTTLAAYAQPMAAIRMETADAFPADVYASKRTAVERLVAQAIRELRELPATQTDAMKFKVLRNDLASAELDQLLTTPLRAAFPKADVEVTSDRQPAAQAIIVTMDVTPRSVTLTLAGGAVGSRTFQSRYVDKAWADDWTVFRNSSAPKRYLRAMSSSPGASEAEAIESAQKDAVNQLAPLLLDTIRAHAARFGGTKIIVTEAGVRARLLSSIKLNNDAALVPDSFVQKFERPYGDVWQASLLVDASLKNVVALANGYSKDATAERKVETTSIGATAGIFVVVLLLYAFLNTVTKGYFLWRLRAIALLVAIGGVLMVFAR